MPRRCIECKNVTSRFHGLNRNLCYKCFVKSSQRHILGGPLIFEDCVDTKIQATEISITKQHAKQLEKRLNELFPERSKTHRFAKASRYIRLLILNDLAKCGAKK